MLKRAWVKIAAVVAAVVAAIVSAVLFLPRRVRPLPPLPPPPPPLPPLPPVVVPPVNTQPMTGYEGEKATPSTSPKVVIERLNKRHGGGQ